MTIRWEVAPDDVINMAKELVQKYHHDLRNAKIGILFRETSSMSNGRQVLGKASKVTPRWRPLLDDDYHFIIWLAQDWWEKEARQSQQRALLDHELQHCYMLEGWEPKIRAHDFEEFGCIIKRHGFWREDYGEQAVAKALQQQELGFVEPAGSVKAAKPPSSFADEIAFELENEGVLADG